jgi:adenosylmethionine-8-amino-7-oxononanoate aminotransferase
MNNWLKKDLKYIWHPYTQMQGYESILIERAQGIKLYDNKGNFYYDTISSWWCNVHGHNHPKINQALKNQLDSLEHVLFAGFTHKPAIRLAEKLISLTVPNFSKVFFSDNGSTAVETALKISFQYWQNINVKNKKKFVCLDYGYHGDTFGAMSVSGISRFNQVFSPLLFETYKIPSPYCYRCPMKKKYPACNIDCINPLEELLKEKNEEICGLILEPLVLAAGGMIVYPKEYLKKVSQLCLRYNLHLILDEVATGFGRTAKMFAYQYIDDIKPDFLCLSKGITAGYLPLGATLTTEEIYKAFLGDDNKTFYHGHTYTANPICCAVALASLEIFEKEKPLQRIKKVIHVFHKNLEKLRNLPLVGDVRYIGLIGGIELELFNSKKNLTLRIYKEGLKNQLILRPLGNVIYFFLPLSIKEEEIIIILEKTYDIIRKLEV